MKFEHQDHFKSWVEGTPAGRRHAKAADRAPDLDRRWFETHPGQTRYVRPIVEGEFPPFAELHSVSHVLVEQVRPGMRLRYPVQGEPAWTRR